MIRATFPILICAALLTAPLLCGCTSGGGGGDNEQSDSGDEPVTDGKSFSTQCGVVQDGVVASTVLSSNGEDILGISINDPLSATVTLSNGDQLVRFLGLATAGRSEDAAITLLNSLAAEKLYLYRPSAACSHTFEGGGVGTKANIITESGKSFTEEVIMAGIAGDIETSGSCGEAAVSSCYQSLKETFTPEVPASAGEFSFFLWKPQAESDYNKGSAVIHFNPCADEIFVNGVFIRDYGPANGRCITARTFKSGCAWGNNIKVEAFVDGVPLTHAGVPYVTVPGGCSRFEF